MEDDGGGNEEKKRGEDEEEQVEMKSSSSSETEAMAMDPCGGQWPMLRFEVPPQRIYHFSQQFRNPNPNNNYDNGNNFLKGVKWSPDGSCFLTSSDDNTLRLFSLPQEAFNKCWDDPVACLADQDSYGSDLIVNEAETVYDYCWYPYMSSSELATCVFATSTRDHPIHLWDAISGQLRCTYRAYDAMDEITAALSVSFNSSGTKLFAGYNKFLRVFDVHRPGRDFEQYPLLKGNDGPSGIVSSIAFSPTHNGMLAIGSYSHTTAVYAEANMELLYVLHGQIGGVTQVLFSKDGNYIYTGGRKDPYILCWDIRNTAGILYKLYRSSEYTNQRISFDIEPCGRHLGTGGEDGLIHIYDLQTGQWTAGFQAASDTVNGFSFHPMMPFAASSSGSRRFSMPDGLEQHTILAGSLAWPGARCTKWYHMLLESFLTAYEVPCEGRGECQESCSLFWFCKLELSNFSFCKVLDSSTVLRALPDLQSYIKYPVIIKPGDENCASVWAFSCSMEVDNEADN